MENGSASVTPESPSRIDHESDLKALHDIFFELSLCQSEDEVCQAAVRLGHERLLFDRLALLLLDQDDARSKHGTWSMDGSGVLRDERGSRIQCEPVESRPVPCAGSSSGVGTRLVAPLLDGHRALGELEVDSPPGHGDFGPERQEVVLIFARIVAQLVNLKRAEAELRLLASTDSLTGTVNRRTALVILEKHIGQCLRSGSQLTLCLADLDGLKIVNDAYGHAAGDEYICRASSALIDGVRASDTVSRIGGDEFLIIFPDCGREAVASILDKINAELAEGSVAEAYMPRLSWGIAVLGEVSEGGGGEGVDFQRCIDLLLELADQRMYDNKRSTGAARPVALVRRAPGPPFSRPESRASRPRAAGGGYTAPSRSPFPTMLP